MSLSDTDFNTLLDTDLYRLVSLRTNARIIIDYISTWIFEILLDKYLELRWSNRVEVNPNLTTNHTSTDAFSLSLCLSQFSTWSNLQIHQVLNPFSKSQQLVHYKLQKIFLPTEATGPAVKAFPWQYNQEQVAIFTFKLSPINHQLHPSGKCLLAWLVKILIVDSKILTVNSIFTS